MNAEIKILASIALIAIVLFAAGCASQSTEQPSTTTTISADGSDIVQDVEQSWTSENDSVEIGEMV